MSQSNDNGALSLTAAMVDRRAQGRDYVKIAEEFDMPAAEVHQRVNAYLRDNYGSLNAAEQRLLMMRRLEMVMNALWDTVMTGDMMSEGKQTKNLLDLLNQITELLDLKRDRVRDEIVELTRAQTELIYQVIDSMRTRLATHVLEVIRDASETGTASELKATLLNTMESHFTAAYAQAVTKAYEEVEENKQKTIQIGTE